jgi:hypothetical protein
MSEINLDIEHLKSLFQKDMAEIRIALNAKQKKKEIDDKMFWVEQKYNGSNTDEIDNEVLRLIDERNAIKVNSGVLNTPYCESTRYIHDILMKMVAAEIK